MLLFSRVLHTRLLRLAGKLFHNNAAAFGKQRSPYVLVLGRGAVIVNVDWDRSARAGWYNDRMSHRTLYNLRLVVCGFSGAQYYVDNDGIFSLDTIDGEPPAMLTANDVLANAVCVWHREVRQNTKERAIQWLLNLLQL